MQSIEQQLRSFVKDNFPFGEVDGLENDDSFLERGIIDSTGVLELVAFLEQTYGIEVQDQELVPANLDSINGLLRFLDGKLAER
jgi:acyl carrier protein